MMGNPDPWGNFAAGEGDVATLAVTKPAETTCRDFVVKQLAPLSQLAEATLYAYADLYGRRITTTEVREVRQRVATTINYWLTGAKHPQVVVLGCVTANVRQAYRDDSLAVLREDMRRWAEALVVSILAGGVVALPQLREVR